MTTLSIIASGVMRKFLDALLDLLTGAGRKH
jgi:hypothetical protein